MVEAVGTADTGLVSIKQVLVREEADFLTDMLVMEVVDSFVGLSVNNVF